MAALEKFEAVEANLVKAERLCTELESYFPNASFGPNPEEYDRCCYDLEQVLSALPKIDGWHPSVVTLDLKAIAEARFDYGEIVEPLSLASFEDSLYEGGRELFQYRLRLTQKRRQLIRQALVSLIEQIDNDLKSIREEVGHSRASDQKIDSPLWNILRDHANQIEVLLGSTGPKPKVWKNFRRHLAFAQFCDLNDIEKFDWPNAKQELRDNLYNENEPLPIEIEDLGSIVNAKPDGAVATKLQWTNLDDDAFERLIFALLCNESGYENPEWLMKTRAPDRGRDLSVIRIMTDSLSGSLRQRVIIQCKHWLNRSIALQDVSTAKDQTDLWREPKVDVLILATSGRFTTDAVQWIERHNADGKTPRIEMWPKSHLERLLASRPSMIAEFSLRC